MNLYGIHNFYIEIFNNISYITLHHYSFIFLLSFTNLVICMILNHYFMYITLRISKIKIFQIYISIKIILHLFNLLYF
jgi:hypothetical protein